MSERNEREPVIGYLCGIAWQHEIGEAMDGTKVYSGPDDPDLIKHGARSFGCGIVEVEVRFRRWVVPQDLHSADYHTYDEATDTWTRHSPTPAAAEGEG